MASKTEVFAWHVEQALEDAEQLRRGYLRDHGWTYTCDNGPGAYWLWKGKLANGAEVRCDEATAFALQAAMSNDPDPRDDDPDGD